MGVFVLMSCKASKSAALYVFYPGTKYTCSECVFMKEKSTGAFTCTFFVPGKNNVELWGSCNYYVKGKVGSVEGPYEKTKIESGYMENKEGFSCKRCEYFNPPKKKCEKVDENSPGNTPGIIHPDACCDFWDSE